MSSVIDSCAYDDDYPEPKNCPKSPDGKHHYEVTCGSPPSEELTCKYCKYRYYTK